MLSSCRPGEVEAGRRQPREMFVPEVQLEDLGPGRDLAVCYGKWPLRSGDADAEEALRIVAEFADPQPATLELVEGTYEAAHHGELR